jgi:TPR repeat protein
MIRVTSEDEKSDSARQRRSQDLADNPTTKRFSMGIKRRPMVARRTRASLIEDGAPGTSASVALELVGADESIAAAARRPRTYSGDLDEAEVERARERIDAENSSNHLPEGRRPGSHQQHHSRSASAELLPPGFNAHTHPVDDLLILASMLHSTSKSRPLATTRHGVFGRKRPGSGGGKVVEDDPRLVLSTKLYGVLSERGSTEGMLMYGLALRAGWGIEPDENDGLVVLQAAVAAGLNKLKKARDGQGDAEVLKWNEERALSVLRCALYELGNSFFHGLGAKPDEEKVCSCRFCLFFQV